MRTLVMALLSFPLFGQYPNDAILPPQPAWNGKSLSLALATDDAWATHFEQSGLVDSPSYADTFLWLEKLVAATPQLKMIPIGKSLEGRTIRMVIASKEGVSSPEALQANGKPTLLAHAGIHAGEIDGKDAGLMLLRDMTVKGSKKHLLDKANFLFIPILSVDGHEWSSAYNRINQRGPSLMGWRTNGRNLNLNRDFSKLETRGVQAVVAVLNTWKPNLYIDIHVTDGMDYQYDITYGFTGTHGHSPAISRWLGTVLRPAVDKALTEMGHIPGPLTFAANPANPKAGIAGWTAPPRFSNGYGDVAHIPTILVENHSLKPFQQRVMGTYVLLAESLALMAQSEDLHQATITDRQRRPDQVTLTWKVDREKLEMLDFAGIQYEVVPSAISGGSYIRWLGVPETWRVPLVDPRFPDLTVATPKGYWIPANWPEIIEKLALHGVQMERLENPREVELTLYRLSDVKPAAAPFEGRFQVTATTTPETRKWSLPKGSAWVPSDQPLCELIVHLLEPQGIDSFFQWGYFHEVLQVTEYFERYALEPLAARMLAEDPELKTRFEQKLKSDESFAKSWRARLHWFYERSPYPDKRHLLYPIGRVEK